jgi:hypothetical protein
VKKRRGRKIYSRGRGEKFGDGGGEKLWGTKEKT